MRETAESVRALGAQVEADVSGERITAPLVVSRGGPLASRVAVDASVSSHPLSALLLAGSAAPEGLDVVVAGPIASRPYADLTIWTLRQFGVRVTEEPWAQRAERLFGTRLADEMRAVGRPFEGVAFVVAPGGCRAARVPIVGDWSSAAFLLGAAAVSHGDVEATGLEWDSPQADRRIADLLRAFGAAVTRTPDGVRATGGSSRPIDADLSDAPDLAPLVGALGCVARGTTRVRGAAHLRAKESDRIATVTGPATRGAVVATAGDHRIAMAFAVAGLAVQGVRVDDRACVAKSFPGFWEALASLTTR
jgi:3-phosphoshikimate 1-carboxyvinyltransferase